MDGAPRGSFWGKLRRDPASGEVVAWHPLVDHSADVAAVTEALLLHSALGDRVARLAGMDHLDPVHVARLSAIAALHDLGKYNRGFQNKAWPGATPIAGHVTEACWLLGGRPETSALARALRWETLAPWADDEEGVLAVLHAAICHHGRPVSPDVASRGDVWRVANGLDPFSGIAALRDAIEGWFPTAFKSDADPFPSSASEWIHAFAGLVMLADWVGSDVRFFPYSSSLGDRMACAREGASRAVLGLGLLGDSTRAVLRDRPTGFKALFRFDPRPVQSAVESLPLPTPGTITLLEAETGSGKTEAALAHYFALARAGLVDGLYFALPTRTAAIQIHRRITEYVARTLGPTPPAVVLAVPGYLRVDEAEGMRLPGFEVLWNDDAFEATRFRHWAAENPKRFLAAPIAVGTIDQALLGALQVSHAHLRRTCLLRQLLVVDEVHASDAYMGALLRTLLETHVHAGGHVLLMSATLGASVRDRLLAPGSANPRSPDLQVAVSTPYPRLESRSLDGTSVVRQPHSSTPDRDVEVTVCAIAADPDAVAAKALARAAEGARVLVLRNTVRDCIATQTSVEKVAARLGHESLLFRCGGVAAPHHSRFTREDREALDQALDAAFGRTSASGGRVVVSTQTIQQSLDIDADILLTDLCPMDVLLQRLGRVHRHFDRERTPGCERARVWVLVPPDRDLAPYVGPTGRPRGPHGLGTVYEDLRCIEATWHELESRELLHLPRDCRELVERATHPEALAKVCRPGDPRWQRHTDYIEGIRRARVGVADLNTLEWTRSLLGLSFPERSGRVLARLGELDRIVRLPTPVLGPFGQALRAFSIPYFLATRLADPPAAVSATRRDNHVELLLDDLALVYDRLGLRKSDQRTPGEALADE